MATHACLGNHKSKTNSEAAQSSSAKHNNVFHLKMDNCQRNTNRQQLQMERQREEIQQQRAEIERQRTQAKLHKEKIERLEHENRNQHAVLQQWSELLQRSRQTLAGQVEEIAQLKESLRVRHEFAESIQGIQAQKLLAAQDQNNRDEIKFLEDITREQTAQLVTQREELVEMKAGIEALKTKEDGYTTKIKNLPDRVRGA